ncbi:hypothetical protein DV736_g14, partial [Chaetothyriales sp. CBS 134916]
MAPHAFSYNKTKAGQAPTFGGRPMKGNGPVKLQTSRSGEWMEASSDSDSMWDEIREGEYVLPSKFKRGSRFSKSTDTLLPESSASQVRLSAIPAPKSQATATLPIRSSSVISSLPIRTSSAALPLLGIPEHATIMDDVCSPSTCPGESPNSSSPQLPPRKQSSLPSKSSIPGLGIHEAPPAPTGILKNSSKISLLELREEQNPTMRALWKAESSRLHSIYGQGTVDLHTCEPRRGAGKQSMDSPMLEPAHVPSNERRDTSISFTLSRADTSHLDDVSDVSSRRLSHVSSTAISSLTSSTSATEPDSYASRADIHKMVEDMRATYLQALETREAPLYSVKLTKKLKKKQKPPTPSGTPRGSSSIRRSSSRALVTPEPRSDIGTTIPDDASPARSQRSTKVTSQPLADVPSLPAIEGSHRQGRILDLGLKRPDSGTLDGYKAESRRSSIGKRKSQRHSRRHSKYSNPSPRNASLVVEQGTNDADMTKEFGDVFRLSIHEFWQSSPNLASTTYVPTFF